MIVWKGKTAFKSVVFVTDSHTSLDFCAEISLYNRATVQISFITHESHWGDNGDGFNFTKINGILSYGFIWIIWWQKFFFVMQNFVWFVSQHTLRTTIVLSVRLEFEIHGNENIKEHHHVWSLLGWHIISHCIFSCTFDILNAQTFVRPIICGNT